MDINDLITAECVVELREKEGRRSLFCGTV